MLSFGDLETFFDGFMLMTLLLELVSFVVITLSLMFMIMLAIFVATGLDFVGAP